MTTPSKIRGHFRALLKRSGDILVPTTLTNARKRTGQAKEFAKRAELLATGELRPIAKKIDAIVRRWEGVRGNKPDG